MTIFGELQPEGKFKEHHSGKIYEVSFIDYNFQQRNIYKFMYIQYHMSGVVLIVEEAVLF